MILYSLCCYNMVTFVRNVNCVALSSFHCFSFHYKWYSNRIERLVCSALIPHLSPNSNKLKGSFHTNCFFRTIIQAINCKEALLVFREIRPNEINTFDSKPFGLRTEYMRLPGQRGGEEV